MPNIQAINAELQRRLAARGMPSVTAVEAGAWLDEVGLLRDSETRPGLPLRRLLRAGVVLGQRQEPNGRCVIERLDSATGLSPRPPAPRAPQLLPSDPPAEGAPSWYEQLRQDHKPQHLKLLFVAESPPDPGSGSIRFFYHPELSQHDNLYRGVAEAIYGTETGFTVDTKGANLRRMQADGYWLIDAVDKPVNHLSDGDRLRLIRQGVPRLIDRCLRLAPERGVVICHARVYGAAASGLQGAGVRVLHAVPIPFPLGNVRSRFVVLVREALGCSKS